jgi:choline-sulfatase
VHRREYYALISHLDAQIGRVLDALEASGQAANTWIFFTADHGLAVGNHGLMGKQNMYEHSVRVPFIVSGPSVPQNERRDSAIYLQDAMATSLALAGAPVPEHVFFHDIRPLLKDTHEPSSYPAVYGAYLNLQRSVSENGWKMIWYPKIQVTRLYHLREDPLEMRDLSGDKEHAARLADMRAKLSALQKDLGDTLDTQKP